jgi:hypothetical protein
MLLPALVSVLAVTAIVVVPLVKSLTMLACDSTFVPVCESCVVASDTVSTTVPVAAPT